MDNIIMDLAKAESTKDRYPTPDAIKSVMFNQSLNALDNLIHTGVSGYVFHQYQLEYLKILRDHGIKTFLQLEKENELISNKASKLPKKVRDIVSGHYRYYVRTITEQLERFESTEDKVIAGDYWFKR